MKKLLAEFIGTATLVLFGCGAAVLAGDNVGQLGIAFAFGLAIVAMANTTASGWIDTARPITSGCSTCASSCCTAMIRPSVISA